MEHQTVDSASNHVESQTQEPVKNASEDLQIKTMHDKIIEVQYKWGHGYIQVSLQPQNTFLYLLLNIEKRNQKQNQDFC